MATPLLDIIGLYEWDNSIFDLMVLPESLEDDRETIIQNILYECRELEISIPSPTAIKQLIKIWSKKRLYYWEELYKTTQYEYNPIDNYDRHEEITDTLAGNTSNHETGQYTRTGTETSVSTHEGTEVTTLKHEGSDERTITRSGYDTTNVSHEEENKVAAYNDSNYQNSEKKITSDSTTYSPQNSESNIYEPNLTDKNTRTPDLEDTTIVTPNITESPDITNVGTSNSVNSHVAHIWGNIGVTTAMKMIEEQRNIINISIIDLIGKDFKNEFCILIY